MKSPLFRDEKVLGRYIFLYVVGKISVDSLSIIVGVSPSWKLRLELLLTWVRLQTRPYKPTDIISHKDMLSAPSQLQPLCLVGRSFSN
jgi:hypothetical protein